MRICVCERVPSSPTVQTVKGSPSPSPSSDPPPQGPQDKGRSQEGAGEPREAEAAGRDGCTHGSVQCKEGSLPDPVAEVREVERAKGERLERESFLSWSMGLLEAYELVVKVSKCAITAPNCAITSSYKVLTWLRNTCTFGSRNPTSTCMYMYMYMATQ